MNHFIIDLLKELDSITTVLKEIEIIKPGFSKNIPNTITAVESLNVTAHLSKSAFNEQEAKKSIQEAANLLSTLSSIKKTLSTNN